MTNIILPLAVGLIAYYVGRWRGYWQGWDAKETQLREHGR